MKECLKTFTACIFFSVVVTSFSITYFYHSFKKFKFSHQSKNWTKIKAPKQRLIQILQNGTEFAHFLPPATYSGKITEIPNQAKSFLVDFPFLGKLNLNIWRSPDKLKKEEISKEISEIVYKFDNENLGGFYRFGLKEVKGKGTEVSVYGEVRTKQQFFRWILRLFKGVLEEQVDLAGVLLKYYVIRNPPVVAGGARSARDGGGVDSEASGMDDYEETIDL